MVEQLGKFIKQLSDLQTIVVDNNINVNIFDYDDLFEKQISQVFYKDFVSVKNNNKIFIQNLFVDNVLLNQDTYLFDVTDMQFLNSVNNIKSINIFHGFINDYHNSYDNYKKYIHNNKTYIIVDFISHFYYILNQIIKAKNQEYKDIVVDIYNKLEEKDHKVIYSNFFNKRHILLPIKFYLNYNNALIANKYDTFLVYKLELNIDLANKLVVKLNDNLPVIDKQKFDKLVNILVTKQIITESTKNYLLNRINEFPLFNDFTIKEDKLKIYLIDYIDVRVLPYLFIVNAFYCKKIYN